MHALPMPAPRPARRAPASPDGFDVQGHRGARGLLPENTLAGFRRALQLGVTTLELDTVVAGDGTVVVSHDPWFDPALCSDPEGRPVEPGEGPGGTAAPALFALDYAEIARYDCGRRGHPRFPRQEARPAHKPRLADVFALAEAFTADRGLPPVFYNVETKARPAWDGVLTPSPSAFVEALARVTDGAGVTARTTLQSFDVRTLQTARRWGLGFRLSLLVQPDGEPDPVDRALKALGFTPHVLSPHVGLVDADLVERARAAGMAVVPWTVNEPAAMERVRALGCAGLITDYPDLALSVLARRAA